jgi:branched-chain amino acid transport system ATP-binding protein
MEPTDHILQIRGAVRTYGALRAVDGFNLALAPGERHGLIGANGAGKSTLFALIAGTVRPTEGRIVLGGRDVTERPPHQRIRAGMRRTFQTSQIVPDLTLVENVSLAILGLSNGRLSPLRGRARKVRDEARRVLDFVGLGGRGDELAMRLSHGERRQLELAGAFVGEPKVILLDEPAAGLSARERDLLFRRLSDLGREAALVMIEHDMTFALGLTDRLSVMHAGRLIATGRPDDIAKDERVHDIYLGSYETSRRAPVGA